MFSPGGEGSDGGVGAAAAEAARGGGGEAAHGGGDRPSAPATGGDERNPSLRMARWLSVPSFTMSHSVAPWAPE